MIVCPQVVRKLRRHETDLSDLWGSSADADGRWLGSLMTEVPKIEVGS